MSIKCCCCDNTRCLKLEADEDILLFTFYVVKEPAEGHFRYCTFDVCHCSLYPWLDAIEWICSFCLVKTMKASLIFFQGIIMIRSTTIFAGRLPQTVKFDSGNNGLVIEQGEPMVVLEWFGLSTDFLIE